jgi:hypothetical protein
MSRHPHIPPNTHCPHKAFGSVHSPHAHTTHLLKGRPLLAPDRRPSHHKVSGHVVVVKKEDSCVQPCKIHSVPQSHVHIHAALHTSNTQCPQGLLGRMNGFKSTLSEHVRRAAHGHYLNEDPMYGCQIGFKCPVLQTK